MILSGLQRKAAWASSRATRPLPLQGADRCLMLRQDRKSFGVRRPGSTARLDLRNIIGDFQIIAPSPLPKSFHDAFAVLYLAISCLFRRPASLLKTARGVYYRWAHPRSEATSVLQLALASKLKESSVHCEP